MDWFLYDNGLRHETVNPFTPSAAGLFKYLCPFRDTSCGRVKRFQYSTAFATNTKK